MAAAGLTAKHYTQSVAEALALPEAGFKACVVSRLDLLLAATIATCTQNQSPGGTSAVPVSPRIHQPNADVIATCLFKCTTVLLNTYTKS